MASEFDTPSSETTQDNTPSGGTTPKEESSGKKPSQETVDIPKDDKIVSSEEEEKLKQEEEERLRVEQEFRLRNPLAFGILDRMALKHEQDASTHALKSRMLENTPQQKGGGNPNLWSFFKRNKESNLTEELDQLSRNLIASKSPTLNRAKYEFVHKVDNFQNAEKDINSILESNEIKTYMDLKTKNPDKNLSEILSTLPKDDAEKINSTLDTLQEKRKYMGDLSESISEDFKTFNKFDMLDNDTKTDFAKLLDESNKKMDKISNKEEVKEVEKDKGGITEYLKNIQETIKKMISGLVNTFSRGRSGPSI